MAFNILQNSRTNEEERIKIIKSEPAISIADSGFWVLYLGGLRRIFGFEFGLPPIKYRTKYILSEKYFPWL